MNGQYIVKFDISNSHVPISFHPHAIGEYISEPGNIIV